MSSSPPNDPGAPNQRLRLLLADNDETLRHSLGLMFANAGYDVVHAANGKTALELYQRNPAHIVIAEMIMPESDGVELLIKLSTRRPRPKFIAITAGGRIDAGHYLRTAKHLGANRVLAKPFCPGELMAFVTELSATA
jgi:two-component system response regulator ArlR